MAGSGDLLHVVTNDNLPARRVALGRLVMNAAAAILVIVAPAQIADAQGWVDLGFANWRPTLYAYGLWACAFCWGQVLTRGEQGKRALFVLPAAHADIDLLERVAAACAAQLAGFKQPYQMHIVKDFPRSTLEKIAKAELRRLLDEGTLPP